MSPESFAHKLARLRREASPPQAVAGPEAAAGARPPGTGVAADLTERSGQRSALEGHPPAQPGAAGDDRSPAAPAGLPRWARLRLERQPPALLYAARRTLGDPAGLEPLGPGHALKRRVVPLGDAHGGFRLGQDLGPLSAAIAALAKDPALQGQEPTAARFLDIETTGLSGGAGTYPFLVAIGRIEGGALVVDQHFLGHPAGEAAMLARIAEELAAGEFLVTFFGKSFDRHRLEDKMRLHGVQPPFANKPHLDLFHPLKRLYQKALGDCRLGTFERRVLDFERQDDLSGAFAPAAWFDHQAGRAHLLEGVFEHNYLDVLSLCALIGHLFRVAEPREPQGLATSSALDPLERVCAENWAKLFRERKDRAAELRWLDQALLGGGPAELWLLRARCARALGRHEEARETLERLLAREHGAVSQALTSVTDLEATLEILSLEPESEQRALRLAAVEAYIERHLHPLMAPKYRSKLAGLRRRVGLCPNGTSSRSRSHTAERGRPSCGASVPPPDSERAL